MYGGIVVRKQRKQHIPVIRLIGTIDEELFKSFSEQLAICEEAGVDNVSVELSSGGGVAYDALAFYSRMRLSSCYITVTAYGVVASAATLILAGGDMRLMARESWVLVHEDKANKFTGKVSEVERYGTHLRNMETQWNELLEAHGNMSADEWAKINLVDTYLTPEECLECGLIDKII